VWCATTMRKKLQPISFSAILQLPADSLLWELFGRKI
jgi:hypothetical protein